MVGISISPPDGCLNAADGHSFLTSSVVHAGGAPDRIHLEIRGSGRRGFAIEETTHHRGENQPPLMTTATLIRFSEAALDRCSSMFLRDIAPRCHG
jgi:hypothetical protein